MNEYLCRIFAAFVGRQTSIKWITGEDLGYTVKDGTIYLNRDHYLSDGLSEEEKKMFLIGVFVHEMLHQIFSSWDVYVGMREKCDSDKMYRIASTMLNILEDPTIEYRADSVISGKLLRALRYMIAVVYVKARPIQNKSALTEFMNALIHFGDMGLIKGQPQNPEVHEYLKEILPEMNALIKKSTPAERADAAVRWTELIRPLWESKDEDEIKSELSDLNKGNGSAGIPQNADGGNGEPEDSEETGEAGCGSGKTEAAKRRDMAAKRLEKDGEPDEESDGAGNSETGAETPEIGVYEDGSDETEKSTKGGKPPVKQPESGVPSGEAGSIYNDAESANETAWEEVELTDEDTEKFEKEMEALEKRSPEKKAEHIQDLDITVKSRALMSVKCLNKRLSGSGEKMVSIYSDIMKKHMREITDLTYALKDIFNRDQDEMLRATSGRYNVKRGMLGTTPKMFDKRRDRQHIDDLAVFINIDESGSMYSAGKIDTARVMAIIFAEVFARLSIPLYVMGFTADSDGYDAVHDHFITWSNTARERHSLVNLRAQRENLDGYSIRYASALLSQRRAEHKILIQISDGQPAASKYRTMQIGASDTAAAIREAKQSASVFGIGLGDCSPQKLRQFYDDTFIWCRHPEDLPMLAIKLLKKIVQSY